MTDQEVAALIQILQRIPLTQAESLWLNSLLTRLKQPAPEPAESPS